MDEDFDEEFGDDVLPTSVNHQAASTYKEGVVTTVESKGPQEEGEEVEEEEEGDVVLYGNMKESAAANNNPADEDDEDELEEEDEGIAIVLKDSTASPSKPQLRFTRGDNRYVRGDHVSPQLQPASRAGNEQFDPSFDELALLGMGGRRTAFDVDIDVLEDKPWRKPGVDISDYFNYGFDETTWREYCIKQQQNRRELAYKKAQDKEAEEKEKAKAAAEMAAYMPPPMGKGGSHHHHHHGPPPHMFRGGPPPGGGRDGGWGGPPWANDPSSASSHRPLKDKDYYPPSSSRSGKQEHHSRRSRSRSRGEMNDFTFCGGYYIYVLHHGIYLVK
ncbi:hypothetical protein, variant [Aphanomyces astaci]|uniref:Pre-mRNA polyadenylation factor Fip1 domain-containing protein n=1 Tax=Aphanomyces astaci TaxID=112090 RepID=W4FFU5_APHAT|nr:hypothetical protein, variant [Aphanomyces astaci]ETV66315.1 hypothetical protein, variant [Aphanomyces astaci]|eukprot:XP_009844221.1 hypothetical protein, variant [Aphanomyces astaci]